MTAKAHTSVVAVMGTQAQTDLGGAMSLKPERVDPDLIERAEDIVGDLEAGLKELKCAVVQVRDAFCRAYPPDGTPEWFAAWGEGRLGLLWDRLEDLNVQEVIDAALDGTGD